MPGSMVSRSDCRRSGCGGHEVLDQDLWRLRRRVADRSPTRLAQQDDGGYVLRAERPPSAVSGQVPFPDYDAGRDAVERCSLYLLLEVLGRALTILLDQRGVRLVAGKCGLSAPAALITRESEFWQTADLPTGSVE